MDNSDFTSLILSLGTRCWSVVSFTPGSFTTRQRALIHNVQEARYVLELVWTLCRRDIPLYLLSLLEIAQFPGRPAHRLDTMLSQLPASTWQKEELFLYIAVSAL